MADTNIKISNWKRDLTAGLIVAAVALGCLLLRWTDNLSCKLLSAFPGAEAHAGSSVRFSQPIEISLVLVLGFLLPMMLGRSALVRAGFIGATVSAAVFLITALVMHQYHRWFPWLVVSAVEVPAAVVCILISKKQSTSAEEPRSGARAESPAGSSVSTSPKADDTLIVRRADPRAPLVPDHKLIRQIGGGTYGEVWLAQSILGSFRGVKVVYRKKFAEDRPYEREFEGVRHFEPISRQHLGLVHILQVGRNRERGYFYCVMELGEDAKTGAAIVAETYEPRTLALDIKTRGAVPARACVRLGLELSDALGFLHSQGLIHRDIKPGNIIYSAGRAKFADIGLVTQVGNDHTWVGTKGFFPSEGTGTLCADIYSLGKTLYCACSGLAVDRFPNVPTKTAAEDDVKTFEKLKRIIFKACENEPALRYQTAADLQHDLRQLIQ